MFVSREAQGGLKENSVLSPEEVDKPTSFFFPKYFYFCISQEALGESSPEA